MCRWGFIYRGFGVLCVEYPNMCTMFFRASLGTNLAPGVGNVQAGLEEMYEAIPDTGAVSRAALVASFGDAETWVRAAWLISTHPHSILLKIGSTKRGCLSMLQGGLFLVTPMRFIL